MEPKYFDFGQALNVLRGGRRVARHGWNGKDMFIMLCTLKGELYTLQCTGKAYPRRDYLYMKAADDTLVPWVASQTDLLAEDWYIVQD